MEKKDNKQCLFDTPCKVMVNKKKNYNQEYKGHAKWLSLISSHFANKIILWHDTSSCTCSIYLYCLCKVSDHFSKKLWYKLISLCMHSLSTSKTPTGLIHKAVILSKKLQNLNWLNSQSCRFVQKKFFSTKLLCANVLCVNIV